MSLVDILDNEDFNRNMVDSKNIIIKNIDAKTRRNLATIQNKFGLKTVSSATLKAINDLPGLLNKIDQLERKLESQGYQINNANHKINNLKEAFKEFME